MSTVVENISSNITLSCQAIFSFFRGTNEASPGCIEEIQLKSEQRHGAVVGRLEATKPPAESSLRKSWQISERTVVSRNFGFIILEHGHTASKVYLSGCSAGTTQHTQDIHINYTKFKWESDSRLCFFAPLKKQTPTTPPLVHLCLPFNCTFLGKQLPGKPWPLLVLPGYGKYHHAT